MRATLFDCQALGAPCWQPPIPDAPAQVLDKLVQVDGADSLLDADTLDGLQANRFMRTDQDTGTTGNLTTEKALSAQTVLPQKRIEFPNEGRASNGIVLKNHRIGGVDRLTFNDPGPNEGVIWKDTAAKVVVAGLDDENEDGALRVINDTAVSLEATDILIKGKLKLNGADAIISWEDAANQQGTSALNLVNRNLDGINVLNFNDAGAGEGIGWNGSQAKIYVSPLDGSNADGYLRLINDDGISLESHVRVTEQLAVGAFYNVGPRDALRRPCQRIVDDFSNIFYGVQGAAVINLFSCFITNGRNLTANLRNSSSA